ncbi:hypothetical protein AB0G00_34995 [Nocardia salmonicida]|uniref:hypothetical protein n=1 Tax=Nocardia TaxID=1817 RepID=UPI0034114373
MTEPNLTPEQLRELRKIAERVFAQFNVYDQMMKNVDLSAFSTQAAAVSSSMLNVTSSYNRLVLDTFKGLDVLSNFDITTYLPVINMDGLVEQWLPSLSLLSDQITLPNLDYIFEEITRRYPANWPTDEELTLDLAKQIVEDEGIPLAYIPRAEIVSDLVHAADRTERGAILVARAAEILDDCERALDGGLHPAVADLKLFLEDAFQAFRLSLVRPTQSVAVAVCTTLIDNHLAGKYPTAKKMCRVTDIETAWREDRLRYELGIAPVVNLLTEWNPKSGKPRPAALSRHVSTHQLHLDHFTPENAILAVMVATSLILALNERLSWEAKESSQ